MKLIKKIFTLLFLLFLSAILIGLGYYFAVTKEARLDPEKLLFSEKTVTFYDGKGEIVRNASTAFVKQTTAIEDIPLHTKQAFIDTEDKRFYRHDGYDFKRIARATWNNIKARSFKEGASTISQQLIKNTHLSAEKTLKRKLREWKLTRALERAYSKEEILERYLNTIYFGHSCFGITSAAEFYFGKPPSELTLEDSAILAGLVKSPNNYSPFKDPERCARRKNVVLNAMLRNESITPMEKVRAMDAPLPLAASSKQNAGYINMVFDELTSLSDRYDFTVGGKIEIHTYLDEALQADLERIAESYTVSDKALFVLDGKTRGYKACVSTIGNAARLPGSLIKPLLVYTPALEEDILSPATPILDEKVDYSGYAPENYDGSYHGYVSARECVEKSLNIPAVKVLEALTLPKATRYLESLGLSVEEADKSLALALGGMKKGYPLKDILAAYACLQRGGETGVCGFIDSVTINDSLVYKKSTANKRVFSEESCSLMTDMLQSAAQKGTAKKLRTLPFEIAAKTGTVGTKNGNTDAYALSYTAYDCAAVWLGNADNTPIQSTGGGTPCNLLFKINQVLYDAYKKTENSIPALPKSNKIQRVDLDKAAYYDTHTLCLADDLAPNEYRISELFKKSAIPLNKSTSFSEPSILPPTLSLENGSVVIRFDKRSPSYYTYKVERSDYTTHTTLYEGKWIASVTDKGLSPNKNYAYTVTPYYQDRAGISVTLPTVTTKEGALTKQDTDILSKEWWEY